MIIRQLYTLLLFFAAPFLMWGLYRKQTGKPSVGKRWKEHFGITPPISANRPIWIHAVSVGETLAVSPFIKKLKQQYPEQKIVITTTTPTGAEQAAKLADIAEHRYMPFDFAFSVRWFLKTINPSQLLIMETELWPNTLHTVAKAGIPITVINARLSERSCQRYAQFQPLFNMLSRNLTKILCQYRDDADRFVRLGVPEDKVAVTGSIKFDIEISPEIKQHGQELRQQLGSNRPVWIAASTHQGEDEQVLTAHQKLLKENRDALLILVPRHPERFDSVYELANQQFKTVRRTESSSISPQTQVYLGNTMGEMLLLMEAADICFMGGSLIGSKVGGHNMLEPAALGKPILTGPSYYNFNDIAQSLIKIDAMHIVNSQQELSNSLCNAFNNPISEQKIQHLQRFIEQNQGANERTIAAIMTL